ncbi:uncharacterized protein FTOL_09159 [Fusarium torulosum]|uniref:Uncharacterized protein n=1 Tax=Fusarium torulosum TaxID=33205 RepID=A0AAE8SLB1_9HYPO|nr:uncharacterized protein FTOL_09159 [Fusarium torulosum]
MDGPMISPPSYQCLGDWASDGIARNPG